MTMRMKATLAAMGLALGMASTGSASAAIIYEDNFDGNTDPLNGTAPDTGPIGEVWNAHNTYKLDGSVVANRTSAYLPFTPLTGNVYKLTASFAVTQDSISIGFSEKVAIYQYFSSGSVNGYATGVLAYDADNNDYDIQSWAGRNANGGSNLANGVTLAQDNVTFEITLDATDALSENWTAAWSATDGTTTWTRIASKAVLGDMGDISYVVFTNGPTSGAGTLEYMKLEVVPEPASLVLMAIGSTLMLVRSRR